MLLSADGRAALADLSASQRLAGGCASGLAGASGGADAGGEIEADAGGGSSGALAAALHQVYAAPEQLHSAHLAPALEPGGGGAAAAAASRRCALAADMYRWASVGCWWALGVAAPAADMYRRAWRPAAPGARAARWLLRRPRRLSLAFTRCPTHPPSPNPPARPCSFGVLLAELATGRPCTQRGGWRMPRVPGECPHLVGQLIVACLSPDPRRRPSAQQALQALLLAGDGGGW